MKNKPADAEIARIARALALEYRALAIELIEAAETLDRARCAGDALPAVTVERFATALKGGMILHHLADRT